MAAAMAEEKTAGDGRGGGGNVSAVSFGNDGGR